MQIKRFDMRRIRLQSHTLSGLIQYPGLARLWKRYFSLHPGIEWFVYLAVFVIGVGGTYSLLWRDPLYALYEARLQTEALSKQYQLHRARLKAAIDLHDKVADKKKEFSQQWSRMFTHQPLSRVLEDVQRLAHQFSIMVVYFSPQPVQPQALYAQIPLRVVLLGGYQDIIHFLKQLIHYRYIITVQDFQLSPQHTTSRSLGYDPLLKMDMLLHVYVQHAS